MYWNPIWAWTFVLKVGLCVSIRVYTQCGYIAILWGLGGITSALPPHWNGNVIILTKLLSLVALDFVTMKTFGAASGENFMKIKFAFQCYLTHSFHLYRYISKMKCICSYSGWKVFIYLLMEFFLFYWNNSHQSSTLAQSVCLVCDI